MCVRKTGSCETQERDRAISGVCFFKLSFFYRHESGPINNIMKDYRLESVKAKTNFLKIINLKVFFLK